MTNKTRFAKLCVDIGESTVKIIKINRSGTITHAALADIIQPHEDASESERTASITAAVKKAAKAARIGGGSCTIVTGGPHIIVRRFSWPDMPNDALRNNAVTEIQPYLPPGDEQYQISCRIIGKSSATSAETGNLVTKLDVLVAAMSKNDATRLRTAVKGAGFTGKRIDIRENAREKLAGCRELWTEYRLRSGNLGETTRRGAFVPTGSFVVLDLADALVNMAVFISGRFYANRYFSTYFTDFHNDSGETGDKPERSIQEFAQSLAAEAASVIDYVHYQERGSFVRCVLLLGGGETAEDFTESFGDNLDIPVISESNAFSVILFSKRLGKRAKHSAAYFLDAYGAAITPPGKHDADLDLRNRKPKNKNTKKRVVSAAAAALILAVLCAAGFYLPNRTIVGLEEQLRKLEDEYPANDVSDADILALRLEIENMRQLDSELFTFYTDFQPALWVLNAVHSSLPPETGLNVVIFDYGIVTLSGTANALGTVADYIENLRRSGLFADDITHSVGNIPRGGESSRLGHRVKAIDTNYEDGAVDFEITLTTLSLSEAPR